MNRIGRPGAIGAGAVSVSVPVPSRTPAHRFPIAAVALVATLMAGCAGVLPQVERTPATTLVGAADAPLVGVAREAGVTPGYSGVWPLLQAGYALDARLALIENARASLDLQYYLIGDDSIGRLILREVRDAALRGVRVRLLLDDLDTTDMDPLLLGLAAYPNVEVRLFNPFVTARESWPRRLIALASDFKRLNHRMHNKLFAADGAVAIVGGRNLADEYFLRGAQGNFIDFDLLLTGAVMPALNREFDRYWNSPQVYPLQVITRASGRPSVAAAEAQATFEAATAAEQRPDAPTTADVFGAPAFSRALAQHHVRLIVAPSAAYADAPDKIEAARHGVATEETLTQRFLQRLADTRTEADLFSPYFIPGTDALASIGKLRAAGVRVRIVTNSLAASDEPLVNVGLVRHQVELLKMGTELYELSSERLKLNRTLRGLLGTTIGRLHAKLAVLDHRTVLVGSMNLDPRSAVINTEIGVRVESAELAEMVLQGFKVDELAGVYQVELRPDGKGVRWIAANGGRTEERDVDPDTSLWQRLQLLLLSWFVPESQL